MAGPSPNVLLAQSHLEAGRFAQAERVARRALQRDPRDAAAAYALGIALREQGQWEQATHFLERATKLEPRVIEYWVAFGGACERVGRFNDGQEAFLRAVEVDPDHEFARLHMADSLLMMGRPEEAARAAQETVKAAPDNFLHWATAATFTCYASGYSPQQRMAAHRAVAAAVDKIPKPPIPSIALDRDPDRPLRVAYLSPDFLTHSVSSYFEPILESCDPRQLIPHCYFASTTRDATTDRLEALVKARGGVWRDLPAPSEAQLAGLLRQDRIDIAVDLAGYTASSILWTLRQRVVPVQVTYLGYPHSTGLANIDYRVVDSKTDPPGAADELASEKLVRLDPTFLCYRVPDDAPAVAPAPSAASADAPITFGSFNLLGKVSEATRRVWARVLEATPGSRLLLKDGVFGWKEARERYGRTLAQSGIDPVRVELIGKTKHRAAHLALYARVDIGLDPFPYNGTTTTCEAMLMGVPVVTLAGEGHCARVGVSLLESVGLPELIASSEDDYVRITADLARDRARLTQLRSGMRDRLVTSPLCDAPAFARRWEAALRQMWREWLAAHR